MASIEQLKKQIDLLALADRLHLKQGEGGDKALFHSPHHPDKHPSLSIFIDHPKSGTGWKDHSAGVGGSCIDLVMHVRGGTASEAMKWLHEEFNIPFDKPAEKEAPREKSMIDYIAERCIAERDQVRAYLTGRAITDAAIDVAMRAKTIGFNTWTSTKKQPGEVGYGGPAAAFLVRSPNGGQVVAVDMRFVDPKQNGDVKTQTQGEKDGYGWTSDPRRLERATRLIFVESAINALSVDSCNIPGTAAYAIRGTGNVANIDFSFAYGKQCVICMDNDEPHPEGHPQAGRRPGPEAAWALYERLTAMNISAVLVDQSLWLEDAVQGETARKSINDVNDYLRLHGPQDLAKALDTYETWLIAGMAGDVTRKGRPRVYLPAHDYAQYWRFRTRLDFTSYIARMERKGEDSDETPTYTDLCGFRIASLSRVSVAGITSTMTGDIDHSPTVYFAVTVQTPRHGAKLSRKVLFDDQLHNTQQWNKFGPIWQPAQFSRMVTILERTAHLGERTAVNFVGLAWRDGQLTVNEGPDCYFTEAEKQCPYYNLTFPSGSTQDARKVVKAYQTTFKQNAAAMALIWGLGGHLKALLGFWPHFTLQADKGSGKSTLIKRLERTLAFNMLSGQSLQSDFRLLTSISYTSHPIGWEELSARKQEVIDKAVAMLQESYQYSITKRGSEMTEYVMCAPVMLAGEDVPVKSLIGKLVRSNITDKAGPLMPDNLPQFPVRQWLQFLTTLDKTTVIEKYEALREYCMKQSRTNSTDPGAKRMAANYAAMLLAWRYVCEFAGIDYSEGNFYEDVLTEMNLHIKETESARSPWVWIMETALSEIDAGNFKHPFKFERLEGQECLLIRPAHIMDHISSSNALRDKWNALPVKTATVFKRQLEAAGVTLGGDSEGEIERTINLKRVRHMTALPIDKLAKFGLSVSWRTDHDRD